MHLFVLETLFCYQYCLLYYLAVEYFSFSSLFFVIRNFLYVQVPWVEAVVCFSELFNYL